MILLPEERTSRIEAMMGLLEKVLPDHEYRYLRSSPLSYVSANFVFRGMSMNKYRQLQKERFLIPKSGDLAGGEAVFTTNKLSEAIGYVEGNDSGAIAVIPRKGIEWRTTYKSILIGSTRYKKVIEELLSKSEDRKAVYTIENNVDLERRQSPENGDHRMLMIRMPQDYRRSNMRFLVWDGNHVFLD